MTFSSPLSFRRPWFSIIIILIKTLRLEFNYRQHTHKKYYLCHGEGVDYMLRISRFIETFQTPFNFTIKTSSAIYPLKCLRRDEWRRAKRMTFTKNRQRMLQNKTVHSPFNAWKCRWNGDTFGKLKPALRYKSMASHSKKGESWVGWFAG